MSLNSIYRQKLICKQYRVPNAKLRIISAINEEAEQWLSCGMTYTLFEFVKEKSAELLATQEGDVLDAPSTEVVVVATSTAPDNIGTAKPAAAKKEQLTKSQKRRQWEQSDHKGEKPRGYNWVDIVKHLSQTGGKEEGGSLPTNFDG